jgi:deazaflavin-dependent oxidoreductase (nitroreductase family)
MSVAGSDLLVRFTTAPAFAWWIRHVAAKLDPWLFTLTNGRWTSMGPPVTPMLTIRTIGRRTTRPHPVHLACVEDAGGYLVVASAMGQERHPAWRYNLEAHPEVDVQLPGRRIRARAVVLDPTEKARVWPRICAAIPQIPVYARRTARDIRVFRLTPVT